MLSFVWIGAAVLAAWVAIGAVLADFVQDRFALELEATSDAVLAGLAAQASSPEQTVSDPRFQRPLSGWYWQADLSNSETLTSGSLFLDELPANTEVGPDGDPLRVLTRNVSLPGRDESVTLRVTAPQAEIAAAIANAQRPLTLSLMVLATGLIAAAALQLYTGLGALRRIRRGLLAIHRGEAETLEPSGLRDIDQVVDMVNAVLKSRQEMVRRTRESIGNLAHAMKTPLASLINADQTTDQRQALVARMNRLIDYHLQRARSAGPAAGVSQRVLLEEVMADIAMVLEPRARDWGIELLTNVAAQTVFIGDRGDLEEIIGNLADNAVNAAAGRVRLSAWSETSCLHLRVEDDGPGLDDADIKRALERGVRLDERGPGAGLGLGIVADLASLNGGRLRFDHGSLGGLQVNVELPA